MGINKLVLGGEVKFDLTGDTVTEATLLKGATAHDKSGEAIEGACTYDADTSKDTAGVAEILLGQTAHARGKQLTGTMPNNGAVKGTIATKDGTYTIPQGYHDGSGTCSIDKAEQDKLIAANIREGITVLGVVGSMSSTEGMKSQSKTATPSMAKQTIVPDEGFNALASVVVEAIPVSETSNAAGGTTITIG